MPCWKMHALLASVSRAQLITSWVENRLLAWVRFSKPIQFHSSPLKILPLPIWLNVKFHYFLPGPKDKFLNTIIPLAPIYVMLFPVSKPMRTPSRVLLVALNVQAITNMLFIPARFKMSKRCRILQCQLFQKDP